MPSEAQRFKLNKALAAGLFVALSLSSQSTAQQKPRLSDTHAENLEQGTEIKREIGAGDAHSYAITLQVGRFVHIIVEQMGIDVVVAILAPDGKPLREMDSINGKYGPESISIVADKAGTYVLQIRPLDNPAVRGSYTVNLRDLRAANAMDAQRIAAEKDYSGGVKLFQGNDEDKKKPSPNSRRLFLSIGQLATPRVSFSLWTLSV